MYGAITMYAHIYVCSTTHNSELRKLTLRRRAVDHGAHELTGDAHVYGPSRATVTRNRGHSRGRRHSERTLMGLILCGRTCAGIWHRVAIKVSAKWRGTRGDWAIVDLSLLLGCNALPCTKTESTCQDTRVVILLADTRCAGRVGESNNHTFKARGTANGG